MNILNRLSLLSYKTPSFRSVATVGAVLLAIAFIIVLLAGFRVKENVVVTVDAMTFPLASGTQQPTAITMGQHSDICYAGVPEKYLLITPTAEGYDWRVNEQYHDSLQYFKVNNENPNRHIINNTTHQQLTLTLQPSSHHPSSTTHHPEITLTGADVWAFCKRYKDQKDFPLHLLVAPQAKPSQVLSSSFLHVDGGTIALVILDEHTRLTEGGTTVSYIRSGSVADKQCKVQFFNVSELTTLIDDSVRHFLRASVKLTEWGAGHVMLSKLDDRLRVSFPKPITFVAPADSLRKASQASSQTITLKQSNNAFPSKSDIFLPPFSNAINFDVCNLEFFHPDDSIVVRDNAQHAYNLARPGLSLFPTIGKAPLRLQSGLHELQGRAGIINATFFLSYLSLPLLVTLVLILLVWSPISPVRFPGRSRRGKRGRSLSGQPVVSAKNLYNSRLLGHYPTYLTLILLAAFVFSVCKSLIALKLSYTYPYFEKITAITPVATATAILLFFCLAMLFNTPLRQAVASRWRGLGSWLVCALLLAALAWLFFFVVDPRNSQHVIDSYFHREVYSLLPWHWLTQYGINDTHRSVPYALFFSVAVVLLVWLVIDVLRLSHVRTFKLPAPVPVSRLRFPTVSSKLWIVYAFKIAWNILCPVHLLVLVAVAVIGSRFGNFGTAFISLFVIIGLTRALSQVHQYATESVSGSIIRFTAMLIISAFYILAAMVGDNGYMTNYLGIVMCLVTFFFLIDRPRPLGANMQQAARKERRNIQFAIAGLTVAVLLLPFVCSRLVNTDKVNYTRLARRVMLYSSFNDLQRNGFRYSESDAEFMVIMSHYMHNHEGGDPLSNDRHFLHPSVSTGQSPVVLNDLSMPAAFFAPYGNMATTAVFFIMLMFLAWMVMHFSISFADTLHPLLTKAMQWRLMAMFMWIGTSLYIYLSYIDRLPFTGRLIPGYGVDAVGEALESAILLAFMVTVTCRKKTIEG